MVSRKIKPVDETEIHQTRHEILQVADIVAREKGIERDEVLAAMEHAILKAAKTKYGQENDVRVMIDRQTGETKVYNVQRVVDEIENDLTDILLADAQRKNPNYAVGDEIFEELPPVEYGRVAAQSARQIIVQKVRDAERTRQYEEFKDRVGEITTGVVKRVEFGNAILDLGKGEAIMRREDIIPRENFKAGDRIRVLITELRPDARGPMITVSRTHPHFMAKLFEQEVPEIYEGIIETRSVARDPGSRAKIAVYSNDSSIDPVGACVGMRGARVQAVVGELQGEKVDIVLWSPNTSTFMVNALAPAEILRVVIDEESQKVDVVVA
jgi:N utilization substance protein A